MSTWSANPVITSTTTNSGAWTCPEHPESSPNRYAELGRVARQWRNLKYRKWFWMLTDLNGRRGQMALFCAACPQDGVNLPPGWKVECDTKP
jgi:hypothetical protein